MFLLIFLSPSSDSGDIYSYTAASSDLTMEKSSFRTKEIVGSYETPPWYVAHDVIYHKKHTGLFQSLETSKRLLSQRFLADYLILRGKWAWLRHVFVPPKIFSCSLTDLIFSVVTELKKKLHGLSPRGNYTDRATAACWRSDCQLLRIQGATWSEWVIPTAVFSVF
jgi:hypothetical protein